MYYLPNIKYKSTITVMTLLVITVMSFISCGDDKKSNIDFAYNPETTPSMSSDSVDMLITSDSGLIKYHLVTQKWDMYDNAKEPYWLFPNKLFAEQYDSLMQVEATLEADSVWNFKNKKLWKLKGNVVIQNKEGKVLKTQEMYWDQNEKRIYSSVYTEMYDAEGFMINGHSGFEGNQDMSVFYFLNSAGQTTVKSKE